LSYQVTCYVPSSQKYVNKILSGLPAAQLHLSTPVVALKTIQAEDGQKQKVVLTTGSGEHVQYDHVILACHSDTALEILRAGRITEEEERILSQFDWNHNEAVLHSDEKVRRFFLLLLSQLTSREFIVDAQEPHGLVMLELPYIQQS
jgi:predicted NAD/FAD-binding protein